MLVDAVIALSVRRTRPQRTDQAQAAKHATGAIALSPAPTLVIDGTYHLRRFLRQDCMPYLPVHLPSIGCSQLAFDTELY